MKTTNLGDKYVHRVTLRLNQEQYDFIIGVSEILGVSPSDYLRMCIQTGMYAQKNGVSPVNPVTTEKGEVGTNENVKTDSNNLI